MSGQITPEEQAALRTIAAAIDVKKLQKQLDNARGKSHVVEKAAFERIVTLQSVSHDQEVARNCWSMIHAVEEIRRVQRGRRVPMNRLRRKIGKDGEVAALEYLALRESEGFEEVISYDVPELLAEVLVLHHGSPPFSAIAVRSARDRLAGKGLPADELVQRFRSR